MRSFSSNHLCLPSISPAIFNMDPPDASDELSCIKIPDLPQRSSHQQTVPIFPEHSLDMPPAYEISQLHQSIPVRAAHNGYPTTDPPSIGLPRSSSSSGSLSTNSVGYQRSDPMYWDELERRGHWEKGKQTPGCCFSQSDGCCFSDTGGCCFSTRDGCCFSDRDGCCFSDRGGTFCSDTEGCCFSSGDASCCSPAPKHRENTVMLGSRR